jgi:hypothetical protein
MGREEADMSAVTYEKLKKQISEKLNARISEFHKIVGDIGWNFRNLGLETAVWLPEKIHSGNIGGINADSYLGYSRIEGRWGLNIRTIEHDHESHVFVSQRVFSVESCGNLEIVVNALRKVPELVQCIHKATDHQISILPQLDNEFVNLRNPDCEF